MNIEASIVPATTSDQNTIDQSWELGDQISLLSSGGNFTFTGKSAGTISEFTGEAVQLPSSEKYIAVFPGDETYTLNGRSFNVSIPKFISPIPEELKCALGTGFVSGDKVEIKHATGYLCFTVSRSDISHIIIKSANGEALSGTFKATVASDGSAGLEPVEASDEILIETQALAGTYFVPMPAKTCNGFSISLKSVEGIAEYDVERYLKVVPGRIYDLGTIDENIEWEPVTAPEIKALAVSSGTATVSWSITNFASASRDILEDWSVGIYNDEGCTDLRVSWDLGDMFRAPEGNILSIGGPFSPRFIFSGLEASKDYYVKAWYTDRPEYTSKPLKISTPASEAVTMATGPAKAGDVILCEDFSELVWGGDMQSRAWGYSDENRGNATALNSAIGANPVGKKTIDGFEHKFYLTHPTVEMGLFNTLMKSVGKTRLAEWSSISEDKSDGKVCARPGNIKLGASNKTGGIVTPALSALEGKALLKVTFKGCPYMELVNDPLTASVMVISTTEENTATIKDYSVVSSKDITFSPELEWKEYSCEILADPTDRIAISSRRTSGTGQQRLLIDDIKIEVVKAYSGTKVSEIKNSTDLQSFLLLSKEYTEDETVTIASDIDLQGIELIGGGDFAGTLDGGNHSIKNWNSNGLWLTKSLTGTIKNLKIDSSCKVTPAINTDFGIFASYLAPTGQILGCENNADITLETASHDGSRFSAFVGKNDGLIKDCVNNGNITINTQKRSGNVYIGAFAGHANPRNGLAAGEAVTFENLIGFDGCTNNGDITYYCNSTGGYVAVGGIANSTTVALTTGEASTNVDPTTVQRCNFRNCTNTGDITVTITNGGSMAENAGTAGSGNYSNIGGVVGFAMGELVGCHNSGAVTFNVPTNETSACMSRPAVGGVAGYVWKSMADCDNSGAVTIKGTFANGGTNNAGAGNSGASSFGGVVGQIGPMVADDNFAMTNCHNTGAVKFQSWMAATNGSASYLGGVTGYSNVKMTNCSNSGKTFLESKSAFVNAGGVVGYCAQAMDNLSNNGETEIQFIRSTAASQQIGKQAYAGGVAGYSKTSLTNSTNGKSVKITLTTEDTSAMLQAGGVVGRVEGVFDNCVNNGEVTFNHGGVNGATVGGVAGWIVSSSQTGGSNNGAVTYNGLATKTESVWLGGYAGHMGTVASVANIKNTKPMTVSVDATTITFIGGICGRWNATSVENVANTADATITVNKMPVGATSGDYRLFYTGGVVGLNNVKATYKNCKNEAAIIAKNELKVNNQVFIGGIAGRDESASTYDGCSNSGDITIDMPNGTSHGGNSCISGIAGGSGASNIFSNCSNTGDMSIKCPGNAFRIGGIAGYNGGSGKCTGCTVDSDIEVLATITTPHIGGMVGYSNPGKYVDCSYSGKISCSTGSLGGILGYTKTNQTMEGCTVNAEVGTGSTAGLFIGGSDANKTYTLGTASKPCLVVSGSKVKGVSVTSISSTDTERHLVGGTNAMTINATNTSIK